VTGIHPLCNGAKRGEEVDTVSFLKKSQWGRILPAEKVLLLPYPF
jgi:hypothetical protein